MVGDEGMFGGGGWVMRGVRGRGLVWFLKNNIGAGGVRGLRDTRRTSAATGDSELRAESSQRERRSALRVSGLASRAENGRRVLAPAVTSRAATVGRVGCGVADETAESRARTLGL